MLKSKGSKNSKSDELLAVDKSNDVEMQLESIDINDNIIPDERPMSIVDVKNSKDNANDSKSKLRQISDSIESKIKNMKIKKDGFEKINDDDDDHSDDKDDIISPNININTSTNTTTQSNIQPVAINQTLDFNICHRTFRCTKTKTIVCIMTILVFFLILFIVILVQTFRNSNPHNTHSNTNINCMNGKKVLIISLDGFRAEYIDRIGYTPNFDKYFMNKGVFARLKPVFPSKTFPNHYSIVTGLYPPSHGIIANHFWDPILKKTFDIQKQGDNDSNGLWFKGEPIWNTIKQKQLTSAGLQYPGSAAYCNGRIINGTDLSGYPTYYKPKYDFNWDFQDRINLSIKLLNSSEPNYDLILLYFEQPDHDGHKYGPESDNVVQTVQMMDLYIGNLMKQMEENKLLDITDIILLSDHGMTNIEKYNAETYLNYDSKIIVVNTSVFPFDEVIIRDWSPIMGVYLKENSIFNGDVLQAMDLMRDAMIHNGDKCKIYENGYIPYITYNNVNDYNNRVPDFIVDAELGYMFYVEGYFTPNSSLGTHGYNNSKHDMFGIFMAHGPSFKSGYIVEEEYLENIHLYEMFCKLMCNVKPNDNNGTAGIYSRHVFNQDVNGNW
eukprot:142677_1